MIAFKARGGGRGKGKGKGGRTFDGTLHPRGPGGRFASKPGSGEAASKLPRAPKKPGPKRTLAGERALKTSGVTANDTIVLRSTRLRSYTEGQTVKQFVDGHPKGRAYALRKLAADQKKGVVGFAGASAPASSSAKPITKGEARLALKAVAQPGQRLALVDIRKLDAEWQKDGDFRIKPSAPGVNGKLDRAKDFLTNLGPKQTFNAPILGVGGKASDLIGFEDGRHRFAAMRDLGLNHAPVSLDPESYQNAKRRGLLVSRRSAGTKAVEPEAHQHAHGAGNGALAGLPAPHRALVRL